MQSLLNTINIVDKLHPISEENTSSAQTSIITSQSIIFVDIRVADYEKLLVDIEPNTEVVILDPQQDGVVQIGNHLQGKQYQSLHIVSHGSQGSLQLGNGYLSLNNLQSYQNHLQQWRSSLTEDADILLYGCDVAAGETGISFVQQLSQMTGADVAASNDLTGNTALGGDWDLEVKTGSIETPLAFSSNGQESFASVLNTPVVGDVIINEFSQGTDGKEWVEILVVKDNLNLQGVRLADGTGLLDLTLSGDGFASLKAGTLIVIYNGNDIDSKISPDLSYNPTSGDYVLQIASNNNTGQYAVNPTTTGSGWNTNGSFTNSDNNDIPRLLNTVSNGGQELHRFARTTTPTSGQFSQYIGNSSAGAKSSSAWSPNVASTNATPGVANPGDNKDWINILRGVLQVQVVSTPQVTINNPSPIANGLFGFSLASNGSEILIGSPGTETATVNGDKYKGNAYLFNTSGSLQRTFSNPSTQTNTQGLNERFSFAVAINTLSGITYYTISAPYYDESNWTQDVGRVYRYDGSSTPQQTLNNSVTNDDSEFGAAIAILSDGTVVVGAPEKGKTTATDNAGQIRLFDSSGQFIRDIVYPVASYIQDARFGTSLAAAANDIIVGAPGYATNILGAATGRAYRYKNDGSLSQTFINPNGSAFDFFGISVASNSDGTRILIGAPGEDIGGDNAGVVYLYDATTTTPAVLRIFTNPDVTNRGFGSSVGFIGDDIIIGAPTNFNIDILNQSVTSVPDRGAVYLYDGEPGFSTYTLNKIFQNPGTGNDGFGSAIAKIDDYRIAITAPFYDNGANTDAGTAYIFKLSNATPTAANTAVTVDEDSTYTFSTSDFNFADIDGDTLQNIQITSLVSVGSLVLDSVAVSLNQEISVTDIIAGKLKFTPIINANGLNYANFNFKVGDGEVFSSSNSAMSINVNSINDAPSFSIGGNQSVRASAGQQLIAGWASNFNPGVGENSQQIDSYIVETINNTDIFATNGTPTITPEGNLVYTPNSNFSGNKTAQIRVRVKDNGGTINGGIDTSTEQFFTINVHNTTANFVDGLISADTLTGTDGADRIAGWGGNDTIYGGLGSDYLFGNAGDDSIYGEMLNELLPTYASNLINNDIIFGGDGNDTIYGGLGNDKLYGGSGNDQIWGGDGDDELWGGLGNDNLNGGAGADKFYLVRGQGVDIIEDFTIGTDLLGCAGGLKSSLLSFQEDGLDTMIMNGSTHVATVKNVILQNSSKSNYFL